MIPILDKDNTDPVVPGWPFGEIRDRVGSIPGTLGNKKNHSDMHQFFDKLMFDAGITPNGLFDNSTNGFQLIQALEARINQIISSTFGLEYHTSFASLSAEFTVLSGVFTNWSLIKTGYDLDFANNVVDTDVVTFGTAFKKGVPVTIYFDQSPTGTEDFRIIINSTNAGVLPVIRMAGVAGSNSVFTIPIGESFQVIRRELEWEILNFN